MAHASLGVPWGAGHHFPHRVQMFTALRFLGSYLRTAWVGSDLQVHLISTKHLDGYAAAGMSATH